MDMPNLSDRTKEVLDLIIDNPGKTAVDIAAVGGIALGQVNGAVSTLNKHKLITMEDGKITATVEAEFHYGEANGVPAPESLTKALAKAAAAEAATAAADAEELDADDAVLAQVAATMAAAPVTEAATETASESVEAATETVADTTAEAATETEAAATEEVVVTSTLIPGRAPASVKPAAEAKPATESKASKARAIFEEMKDRPRKEIMARLMTECKLTQNGANTYLYNFRKQAGMVKARDAAAPAEATATDAVATTVAAGEEPAFVPEPAAVENVVIDIEPTAVVAEAPAEEAIVIADEAEKVGE